MTDWTGSGRSTREVYQAMAERDLHGVSPSYEAICRAVADSDSVCALLEQVPRSKRQPTLLLAAARYLGAPIHDPRAALEFVTSEWDAVAQILRTRRTQTNEPGRCATLLPLLAGLPQPLALLEVGASAGLCLYPDRYRYRYTRGSSAHLVGGGAVELACEVTGPVPLPHRLPEIVWRTGVDLNPLHADREDDRRWLAALIWPEQRDRVARLDRALDLVAADPPHLVAGDLLTALPPLIDTAPPDATLVVFHSAVLGYLDSRRRREFTAVMHELHRTRGIHWVSNEAPGVIAGTDLHPEPAGRFVVAHRQEPVALGGPHGHTLHWLDATR